MMERLTRCVGYQNGNPIYKTNIDMRCIGAVDKLKNALGEYEDLEEQGLLLRLPCKVGDTVYYILGIPKETPCVIENCTFELSDIHRIGKTLFLTKEEAEQKLREMESK